jgi:hypothetical protein
MSLAVAAGTVGSYTLVGTNSVGASSQLPVATNTVQVISPDGDADWDGLTNAVEIAIGTNPVNAITSGNGLPDGGQVFYGLNPIDPTVAGKIYDGSGLTVLQDFQLGLSPINPNLVPPAVSQVSPKNGAFVNTLVVVGFNEPLQAGTSLSAAQNAITRVLGSNTSVPASSQLIAGQTLQAYLNRTCCGNSVVAGTVSMTGPAGGVAGNAEPSSDGLSAIFAPTRPLQSNTPYTVHVNGLRDAAGNLMTKAFSSVFTTGSSFELPQVLLTNPGNGTSNVPTTTSVSVTFSTVINPVSVTQQSLMLVDTTTGIPVSGTISMDPSNTTATFVPNQPLTKGDFFAVTLT